ncbi:MAG TPA: PAS domain-containing protein [Candidatus Cybelea sp.]|nr:PAS domain-containing protein [Candidatus Cybelea sp.]
MSIQLPKRRPIELPPTAQPTWAVVETMAATIAQLLHPHAEVVLHDLATRQIAQIWNPFSGRKPGEPSDLDDIDPEMVEEDVIGPYEKASPKGARLKSISAVLRNQAQVPRYVLCINLDVSQFDAAARLLQGFAASSASRPEWMFRKDIREQINLQVADYLKRHNLNITALDQAGRVALIAHLDESGAFQTRRAVDHIAAALDLSRTTVYMLLREARTPKGETKARKRK